MQTLKKSWKIILAINLVLIVGVMAYITFEKEKTLKDGQLVLLKLAPKDPRSLMQGDYMTLRYDITQNDFYDSIPNRGYLVVKLDDKKVASKVRYQAENQPLAPSEYAIKYYHGSGSVNIGAESYFFQEGKAELYDSAQYGGLRLDATGKSVLVGLYDERLKLLQ
jgi:uncharacterized membrane-anchored protein